MKSKNIKQIVKIIKDELIKNKDSKRIPNVKKYLKNKVETYGIRAPAFDLLFKNIYNKDIKPLDVRQHLKLSQTLIERAAVFTLKRIVKKLDSTHLNTIHDMFLDDVYEWATCDTLSSVIVCEIIKNDDSSLDIIEKWKDSDNIWIQRASCVSFVKIARYGKHTDIVLRICETVVNSSERFVQLGCGWVIRELSIHELDKAVKFIKDNYSKFSREGLRYAIEKMKPDLRSSLLNLNKKRKRTN